MADEIKIFKVTIDNITVEVPAGTTILQAARKVGGDVAPPAMCYYTPLKGSGGKCRTCLVEVAAGSAADRLGAPTGLSRRHRRHRCLQYSQPSAACVIWF